MNKQIALVTGANKGIGYGIAKHLGLSGWQVIIGARDEQRAEKAIDELRSAGVDVLGWVNIELRDLDGIERAAKEINDRYPDLSLLVNNAGIPGDMSVDSQHTEISVIRETLDVNFVGTFALTKALMPLLTKNQGRIVNITVPSEISPYWHPLRHPAGGLLRPPRSHHHRPQWQHGVARLPRHRDGGAEDGGAYRRRPAPPRRVHRALPDS